MENRMQSSRAVDRLKRRRKTLNWKRRIDLFIAKLRASLIMASPAQTKNIVKIMRSPPSVKNQERIRPLMECSVLKEELAERERGPGGKRWFPLTISPLPTKTSPLFIWLVTAYVATNFSLTLYTDDHLQSYYWYIL